jgi:nucleoside-diphosphate-sugar epimerase
MSTVLVTGGTGFLGSHAILKLLIGGHTVRTTLRNSARAEDVHVMLRQGGLEAGERLRFFTADLEQDGGWDDAAAGCDYVLHMASPFPAYTPANDDELIVPARAGALRVLQAARRNGVKRVVLTSSFAAIGYGHDGRTEPYSETDWSDAGAHISAYAKSKTLAERAAWHDMQAAGGPMQLAVVNPVAVFGPVLGPDFSTSILIIKKMLDGDVPGLPRLSFGVVDVRDVIDLHLLAMTHPAAVGERFLACAGHFLSMYEIAMVLRERLGAAAARAPSRVLPNWLIRIAALRDKDIKLILPELGKPKDVYFDKANRVLGWTPRSASDAIVATAESLIAQNLLKQNIK